MTYLLDTCAFLKAAVSGETGLGRRAKRVMLDSRNQLLISTASLAELAYLSRRGRLKLEQAHIRVALSEMGVEVIPLRESHIEYCFTLPLPPNDPLDRMIISTAIAEGIPVISSDETFGRCKGLKVVWD